MLEAIHYDYKSKSDRKLRRDVKILYDEKYAEFFVRVIYAEKVTISSLLFVFAFNMYGLADSMAAVLIFWLFAGVAFYYYGTLVQNKISSRSDEMLSDFSNVVSQLALLTNAGMIMREAWAMVAYNGDSSLYLEMQKSVEAMNNGLSEMEAYHQFGNRCVVPEIKKFTSTIIQGIQKGNKDLSATLEKQSAEVWEAKKQNVIRQGEKANSKLIFPMLMMFMGILIMIIIPIFTNIGI
jgi:tight adherence protein C